MKWRIDWRVSLTALLLILSLTCTVAYMLFGPRVPWPSIVVFYVWDWLVFCLYCLARLRQDDGEW